MPLPIVRVRVTKTELQWLKRIAHRKYKGNLSAVLHSATTVLMAAHSVPQSVRRTIRQERTACGIS